MNIKFVFKRSRETKLFRLFRITGCVGTVGNNGYSWQFSIGLCPKLFKFKKSIDDYNLTIFGIRFHFMKSYGGIFT